MPAANVTSRNRRAGRSARDSPHSPIAATAADPMIGTGRDTYSVAAGSQGLGSWTYASQSVAPRRASATDVVAVVVWAVSVNARKSSP